MDYVDNPMPQIVIPLSMKSEFQELNKVVGKISEDDFIPVSESYGNMLSIPVEDFPDLAKEERGSEVMLIVRGAVKGISKEVKPMLELYIWDAAKVHGCSSKRKNYDGVKQALMVKKSED